MIFKIVENTQQTVTENAPDNQQQLSLIEQLEKQKQEIELKMQEEINKKEEEKKRLLEEEEKKKAEEEKKRIEDEKREAKKKKQSIPKNVRIIVWNHYIGEDIIKHKCLCCKKVTISNTNFEVGHVLSEKNGGTHEINNLRPICFACNHSMGAENMIDFVVKFGLYIG
jgi:5-methylcytosine-specific restriction endonuclease McrA